mgnify:CR=1 FL=1
MSYYSENETHQVIGMGLPDKIFAALARYEVVDSVCYRMTKWLQLG